MPAKSLITRFLAIVMAVISANASTADVSIESTTPGQPTNIFINGALSWDQADQFIQKVEAVSTGTVFFNSKGGDLLAGLIIGQAIRRKKFATVVKRGGLCESVCGLAWLGGAQRFLEPPSRIGFRAAADDWERGNASLGAYLNELGLSAAAVNFITDALDRDANWLDQARAEKLGIAISLWPHSETAPPEPGIPAESLWSYNNSTLRLVIDGAQWKFYYEAPRPELVEMGIRRGTCFLWVKSVLAAIAELQWFFRHDAGRLHTRSVARFQLKARPFCYVVRLLRSTVNAESSPLGML